MPTAVFQSAALPGNYNITSDGSGYVFSLSLISGSLPSSNVYVTSAALNVTDTFQFSNKRLAIVRNEDTGADLCAAFTTSGASASGNVDEPLNVTLYNTLALYSGYNPLRVRIRGAGRGTSSSEGNVMNLRVSGYITVTVNWEYSFTSCVAPSSVSLSASVSEGDVSVSYSGAGGGTNNGMTGLEVQYADSSDNSSFGAWAYYGTVSTSSGTGVFAAQPSSTRAWYRKFRLRTLGTAGAGWESGWIETGSVRKNSAPAAPGVTAPVASKTIYNSQPRVLATVGSDADGHTQTMAASGYAASSAGAQPIGKKVVLRRSSAAGAGAVTVSVISTDALGAASGSTDRSFTYAVPAWTDPALVAGTTLLKAAHMTELQTAINNVRAYYGLAAYGFTAIVAGVTGVAGWADHMAQLRAAIDEVVALVNGWDTANGTNDISLPAWITILENKPAAAIIQQVRDAIPLL